MRLARKMRASPTPAEARLWLELEPLGFKSQVIYRGFILDFYHEGARLAIEVDGSFHDGREAYDQWRTSIIQKDIILVMRFSNAQALRTINLVVAQIKKALT